MYYLHIEATREGVDGGRYISLSSTGTGTGYLVQSFVINARSAQHPEDSASSIARIILIARLLVPYA